MPRLPRYGPIFKIAIFRHKTWPLAKVPEVAQIYSLSTPPPHRGGEIKLIFALRAAVSKIRADFQLPYLAMKLGHWPKFQKLHILYLNYPRIPNFTLVALRLAISKILAILHFPFRHNVKFQSFIKKV